MESDSKADDGRAKRKLSQEDPAKTDDQWVSKGYSGASKIRPGKSE